LLVFPPAYVALTLKSIENTTEVSDLQKIGRVSISVLGTLVVIEGIMRDVIVDEHCIMSSIRPKLGSQICIEKHTGHLVHDGEVETLSQSI
jgi:hypothetical protein